MNHLLRELAPISDSAWRALDEEARERLRGPLAARRLVDYGRNDPESAPPLASAAP